MKTKVIPKPLHHWLAKAQIQEFIYTTNSESDAVTAVSLEFEEMYLDIHLDCAGEKHSMVFLFRNKERFDE